MKKIVFPFLIFLLIGCGNLRTTSRVNDQYKPLSSFKVDSLAPLGSDTTDYLYHNFVVHKDKYVGKPFETLMKDLRLEIHSITFVPIYYHRRYCEEIRLNFKNPYIVKDGVKYNIIVLFADKFEFNDLWAICKKDSLIWSKNQYKFLKNRAIKNIFITDSRTWK